VLILACKVRMKTHSTDKPLAFWGRTAKGEQMTKILIFLL
jgi:hypothetical protein